MKYWLNIVKKKQVLSSQVSLIVCRRWLSTVSDRAFPLAAAAGVYNELPHHITCAPVPASFLQSSRDSPILSPSLCSVCEVVGHCNRFCYLLTHHLLTAEMQLQ